VRDRFGKVAMPFTGTTLVEPSRDAFPGFAERTTVTGAVALVTSLPDRLSITSTTGAGLKAVETKLVEG
jgi:hypothetical protein